MEDEQLRKVVLTTMGTSLELQLRAVHQLLGEEEIPPKSRVRAGSRRQSLVDQSVQILTDASLPMHVNDIVTVLREKFGRITDRDSVSSALGKKARQGILVRQSAPATFELLTEDTNQ